MKKAFFQITLVYLFIILGLTISSQISKKLWGIDFIGEINDIRFTDNSNALITTKNGILAVLDLDRNELASKKNNIHANHLRLETREKFSIMFDEITGSIDIVENKNFKIKNSINMSAQKVSSNYKISLEQLKEKDSFIGVFIDGPVLKVFNEDKILRSFESKTSDVFIDFFINTDKFEIKILSFNAEEGKIKVSNLDLKVKSIKIEYFFDYKLENNSLQKNLKTLISNETFMIYNNSDNSFVFGKLDNDKSAYEVTTETLNDLKGLSNCEINPMENIKYFLNCRSQSLNRSVFLLDPQSKSDSKLKSLEFAPKEVRRDIIFDNKNNRKDSIIFVVRKNHENNNESSVEALRFDDEKSSFISLGTKNFILSEGDEIKIIRGNYNTKNKERWSYIVVTKLNQIRTVLIHDDIFEMKIVLNQKFLNIVKSEIITVKNLEKKKTSKPTLNTLSSLIHQKDITKVVKNAYSLFVSDVQDIYFNMKNSITSLINPKNQKSEEIITSKNEKHFLILFSANSELFILDAITGEKKYEKKFPNFSLVNIITKLNSNPLKTESKQNIKEIENPIVNFELKNIANKSDNEILLIQINLQDFSYQEIDFNLNNTFSIEDLTSKINSELSHKDFKETIEFDFPSSINSSLEENDRSKKDLIGKIILTYNENQNTLFGMKVSSDTKDKNILNPFWNFILNNHKLMQYKLANVPENVHTVYNSSGKILYKHIDRNVILLISNIEKTENISVTLISVINGKVLYQTQIANVDLEQKINSIFDENFVIINYVKKNKNVLRNEVFTIEIMRREIEHSLTSLFQKIFNLSTLFSAFNPLDDDQEENFNESLKKLNSENEDKEEQLVHSDDLVFLTKTFFLPRKVKKMFLNETKLNVANKYIIFLLESNQVFLVDKRVLSPRRPLAKVNPGAPSSPPVIDPLMNSPYADLESPAYFPNIVFDPKFIVDVDYFYSQIDNLSIHQTKFESTFILCTTGLSLNCYKVYPDKTFDYFVSLFPNVFILIALLVLFVFTFTFRKYVKKLELKQLFLNS